jgi:hypothetical protein
LRQKNLNNNLKKKRKLTKIHVTVSTNNNNNNSNNFFAFDNMQGNDADCETREKKVDNKIRTFFFCEDHRLAYVLVFFFFF